MNNHKILDADDEEYELKQLILKKELEEEKEKWQDLKEEERKIEEKNKLTGGWNGNRNS